MNCLKKRLMSCSIELFEGCAPVLAGVDRLTPDVVHPSVVHMFEQVARRAVLYRRLIGHGGSAYFIRRFQARNEELFLQVWKFMETPQSVSHIPAEARACFGASATLGIFSYWLEEGEAEPPGAIAAWYWRLVRPVWFDAFDDDLISAVVVE